MFHKDKCTFSMYLLAISLARSWGIHKLTLTSSVYDFVASKKDKMFSTIAKEYDSAIIYLLVL
jgi:hypothetical protein